jgi:hypothetical protein
MLALLFLSLAGHVVVVAKPNFVILFVDDMGISESRRK